MSGGNEVKVFFDRGTSKCIYEDYKFTIGEYFVIRYMVILLPSPFHCTDT